MIDAFVPRDLVQIALFERNEGLILIEMLLLEGICVMNEAMLSGESNPLQKECIQDKNEEEELSINQVKMHILFARIKRGN